MNEEERKQKHLQQTEEIYAAIGKFAVKFELVCHAMNSSVVFLLQQNGLQNQLLANAVLAGLTADPLRKIFLAVIMEFRSGRLTEEEKRILSKIVNQIGELGETRNDVIHRTWYVGYAAAGQDDFSSAAGLKFSNSKKGTEFRPLKYTCADFDSFSQQADALVDLVNRIDLCIVLEKSFEKHFVIEDGVVKIPMQNGKPEPIKD